MAKVGGRYSLLAPVGRRPCTAIHQNVVIWFALLCHFRHLLLDSVHKKKRYTQGENGYKVNMVEIKFWLTTNSMTKALFKVVNSFHF